MNDIVFSLSNLHVSDKLGFIKCKNMVKSHQMAYFSFHFPSCFSSSCHCMNKAEVSKPDQSIFVKVK